MRGFSTAACAAAALFLATRSSSGEPPRSGEFHLTTLYRHDPLRSTISLADGSDGHVIQDGAVLNRSSDLDFGNYYAGALTIGIEGGRRGVLLDLGSQEDLAQRYGYSESVGAGQGFASLRVESGHVVIRRASESGAVQTLKESSDLFGPAAAGATRPAVVGHVYLARLTDEHDRAFERIAKILVVAQSPGESVTIRWALMGP